MRKYIFIFTVLLLFLLAIKISSNYTSPSTQMIINSPSLNNYEMLGRIENELSKINGVSSYELSISSGSALVNYDDKKVDDIDILAAFNKWGCEYYQISYNPIF